MMTTKQERYAELVALAQLYLLQEHDPKAWLPTDAETFKYFKAYAQEKKQKQAAAVNASTQVPASRPALPIRPPLPIPLSSAAPKEASRNSLAQPTAQPEEVAAQAPSAPQEEVRCSLPEPKPIETPLKNTPSEPPKSFRLEPFVEIPAANDAELKKIFLEKFPGVSWLETPLPDLPAQEQSRTTSAEIVILVYKETGKSLQFLQNFANAIQTSFGKAEIVSAAKIERLNAWEDFLNSNPLRLIVTSYAGAQSLPGLMKHFRESPKQGHLFFGKIHAVPLTDINLYLREPQLKRPLWQSIQSLLSRGS